MADGQENFKFENPTYIVKALEMDMKSPTAGMKWPQSGPVDDRANFVAEKSCGNGLYGFTIDHILHGKPYLGYFEKIDRAKYLLILEVESSEVVADSDNKCKVPRCNIVECFHSDQWKNFVARWVKLLDNPEITQDAVEAGLRRWLGELILTDEIRRELRAWVEAHGVVRQAGDGCSSDEERATYERLNLLIKEECMKRKPTPEEISEISDFMNGTTCPAARMEVWRRLQKSCQWLFPVHPFIEKVMIATATGSAKGDKYPLSAYQGWYYEPRTPYAQDMNKFSKEDQTEIRSILSGFKVPDRTTRASV